MGRTQLIIGILLIILGTTVFRGMNGFSQMPNMTLLMPGVFISFIAIPIIITGFSPELTKLSSQVRSETMDYAGEDMQEAMGKTTNVIKPAVKDLTSTVASGIKEGMGTDMSSRLREAKSLLDRKQITQDEYDQMRKNILGI